MENPYPECTSNTPLKHEHFEAFVNLHTVLWKVIVNKNNWISKNYLYVDLNSGPGCYPDCSDVCSPLGFLKTAIKQDIKHECFFVEREIERAEKLKEFIKFPHTINCHVIAKDNLLFSKNFCTNHKKRDGAIMGLVYADPFGAGKNEFECLEEFAKKFRYLDLLIHFQASPIKRCLGAFGKEKGFYSLEDLIKKIDKKKFLIRTPYGKHQFSFLFCTNFVNMPEYKKIGFYDLDSEEGQKIFATLNSNRRNNENKPVENQKAVQ